MSRTTDQPDRLSRFARFIGDLDHPFYDDERNRWVWYEASAMGMQLALLGSFLTGAVVVAANGSELLPWVILMMMPTTAGAMLMAAHTERHAATYAPSLFDFRRPRGLLVAAVLAVFVITLIGVGLSDGSLTMFGAAIAVLIGFGFSLVQQRALRRSADDGAGALDDEF